MISPIIEGTFIWLNDYTAAFEESDWCYCFDVMQELGFHFVIPTPCSRIIEKSGAFFASAELPNITPVSTLSFIMKEVERRQMEIYLSVPMIPYGPRYEIAKNMEEAKDITSRINQEIWHIYAGHPGWKGWYIPHEIHELWFLEPLAIQQKMIDYHRRIIDQVKALSSSMKVMIAPYFTLEFSPPRSLNELSKAWTGFLRTVDIDILMMQDGRGCERGIEDTDVQKLFQMLRRVCNETSTAFWADVETFTKIEGNIYGPAWRQITTIQRLQNQLETAARYTDRIGIWEFISTMLYTPHEGQTAAANQLLYDYKEYIKIA